MNKALVKTQADTLKAYLEERAPQIAKMAEKMVKPEHLVAVAMGAAQRNPVIAQCTPFSVAVSMAQATYLGFEAGDVQGMTYIVPYREKGTMTAHLIVGYKGLIDLAHRHPAVLSIESAVVCEGDEFDYSLGTDSYIKHKISPDHTADVKHDGEGGVAETNVLYAWVVVVLEGGASIVHVMSIADIKKHRKHSRATSGPWYDHFGAMCRKTALRVALKTAPQSKKVGQALALEDGAESGKYTGDVIELPPLEVIAEEGGNNPPEEEHNGSVCSADLSPQDTHEPSPPSPANPSEISDAEYEAAMDESRKAGEA